MEPEAPHIRTTSSSEPKPQTQPRPMAQKQNPIQANLASAEFSVKIFFTVNMLT
jgi:hypothetical protein